MRPPEGNTVYHVPMVIEYLEQFLIPVRKFLFHLLRQAVLIRIEELLEFLQLELRVTHGLANYLAFL